jgi:hypothetical protein
MENPDTALARTFQNITSPLARIASLTNLVSVLSPWERRHLRLLLGDRDGLTRFEDIPLDLVHLLLPYLRLDDVLACTRVSRSCRGIWTSESVLAALSTRFFPGLPSTPTFDAFLATCRRYFRRRRGEYTSVLDVQLPYRAETAGWDADEPNWGRGGAMAERYQDSMQQFTADAQVHPDGHFPASWPDVPCSLECYGGGNVVGIAGSDFVVDNLYTRTRRVVSFSRGRSVLEAPRASGWDYSGNVAASEKLVVFFCSTDISL